MRSKPIRLLAKILAAMALLVAAFYTAIYLWNLHVDRSMRRADGEINQGDGFAVHMREYSKQGRYDDAIQVGLQAIHNMPADAAVYQQLAMIYITRARKEPAQREHWVGEAASSIDKALAVDGNDPVNAIESAHALRAAAEMSSDNACSYYQRALALSSPLSAPYTGTQITIKGQTYPVDPVRKEFTAAGHTFQLEVLQKEAESLSASLKTKISDAGCK